MEHRLSMLALHSVLKLSGAIELHIPPLGQPPFSSDVTLPPVHPSSLAIRSVQGGRVLAFLPAWASWIPILPPRPWT